jgi:predicted Zn finger-like uncharacterized protein
MEYTFECGSCHAIYKLDENQITQKGVKITCPRCLNYFILKKGLSLAPKMEAAYIEYVIEDGVQAGTPPKVPQSQPYMKIDKGHSDFTRDERTEKILTSEATEKIYTGSFAKGTSGSFASKKTKSEVVTPYPTLKPKKSKFLPYLLVCFLIALLAWILYSKIL